MANKPKVISPAPSGTVKGYCGIVDLRSTKQGKLSTNPSPILKKAKK